jgi:predicted DCC family thiol-disulfide oxidoreductase YuxK
MNATGQNIILFDGHCTMCSSLVRMVIKNDHKATFMFCSLESDRGKELLRQGGLSAVDFDSFVLILNGTYAIKSTAALRLTKALGGWWTLLYGFIIVPKFLRDWVYDLVAKYRYRVFGKTEMCMMPTPEIQARFLN